MNSFDTTPGAIPGAGLLGLSQRIPPSNLAAEQALLAMDVPPDVAARARELFRVHDEETLQQLYGLWQRDVDVTENPTYVEAARQRTAMLKDALALDRDALEDRKRSV